MCLLGLYLPLLCGLLLRITPIVIGCPDEKADEKRAGIDHEIAKLEQKRATELLFFLELLIQKKDYARAADQASRILLTPPTSSEDLASLKEALRDLALGFLRAEKAPRKAAELCESMAARLGDDAILFYIASLAYGKLGMQARQKEYEEKARRVLSEDQELWVKVGSFFARREEWRTALEAFKAGAALSSEHPTHYNAKSETALASIYCRLGDYEEALRHCNNLQEIARRIVVSRTSMALLTATVYTEKARDAEIEERYDDAIEDYKKAAEFSPHPGAAYRSIGEQYLKLKKYAEAEKWFKRAVADGFPAAYAGLGDVRKALGKPDEAEKEYAKCQKALAEHIKNDPDEAANYNDLARFYASHGKELDKGLELAKRAVELAPDSPEYLDTLAELYYRKGDREAAIREIKKAIALNPPHIKYYQKQLDTFQKQKHEQKRVEVGESAPLRLHAFALKK